MSSDGQKSSFNCWLEGAALVTSNEQYDNAIVSLLLSRPFRFWREAEGASFTPFGENGINRETRAWKLVRGRFY